MNKDESNLFWNLTLSEHPYVFFRDRSPWKRQRHKSEKYVLYSPFRTHLKSAGQKFLLQLIINIQDTRPSINKIEYSDTFYPLRNRNWKNLMNIHDLINIFEIIPPTTHSKPIFAQVQFQQLPVRGQMFNNLGKSRYTRGQIPYCMCIWKFHLTSWAITAFFFQFAIKHMMVGAC